MKGKHGQKRPTKQKESRLNWLPIILLAAGVLLLGAGVVAYVTAPAGVAASASYTREQVATGGPIVAKHEMGEGPAIPFLPRNEPQPSLQVSEDFHDFGVIGPQDVVAQEFVLRNTGEAPLTISRAYTTCGCTVAEISASVIPPGQVATVKLIFDAGYHDAAGQTVRRGLIIENNDPQRSQSEIWIQATVRSS